MRYSREPRRESPRHNDVEIFHARDLADRVRQKSGSKIFPFNTRAVVGYADPVLSAPLDLDRNTRRARVDAVFDEFFYHRIRAVHHLARGDAVKNGTVQNIDLCHKTPLSFDFFGKVG